MTTATTRIDSCKLFIFFLYMFLNLKYTHETMYVNKKMCRAYSTLYKQYNNPNQQDTEEEV